MEVYIEPAVIHGKLDCIKYLVEEARTPLTLGGNFAEKQHAAQKKSNEVLNTGLWGNASVLRIIQQSTYNKPRTDD